MTAARSAVTTRRLPRAQRREQILGAATRAFARAVFTTTGVDLIGAEAGVTARSSLPALCLEGRPLPGGLGRRGVLYLREVVGADTFDDASIPALLRAVAADTAAFRPPFRHASRETEFRDIMDTFRSTATEITHRHLADITDDRWRSWAAALLPTLTTEAVIAWLDAGHPDPDQAARRIRQIVDAVTKAAQIDGGHR